MENLFLEAVRLVNPIQLIIIALIVFYFYNRLDQKIEKLDSRLSQKIETAEKELKQEIKTINQRIDSLYQLIVSVFKNAA